jgi:hypothetical protein
MLQEYSYTGLKARGFGEELRYSIGQEIEDVPARLFTLLVQFGIPALFAGDGNKPFVLHIENLGKIASGSLEAVAFIVGATAFGTHILLFFHGLYFTMKKPQIKRG